MAGFGYTCAVVLAGVFVWAGMAKVARPEQTASGFAALGVPVAAVAARAVPAVELALAVCLLALPRAGGVAALLLLAAFSGIVARAVRAGSSAPCNCFGAAGVAPISARDLVRNVLLALLAAAALVPSQPTVPGPLAAVAALASIAAAIVAFRAAR